MDRTQSVAVTLGAAATFTSLALWGVIKVTRWAFRRMRAFGHFLDDVMGSPARPGQEARPGLMDRVGALETSVADIHHEVTNNDGSSLKDSVHRQEAALADHINVAERDKEEGRKEAVALWGAIEATAKAVPPESIDRTG